MDMRKCIIERNLKKGECFFGGFDEQKLIEWLQQLDEEEEDDKDNVKRHR